MTRRSQLGLPALALALVLASTPPVSASRYTNETPVQVTGADAGLTIAGNGMVVRIAAHPLQFTVQEGGGRTLLRGVPGVGPLSFALDPVALERLTPGRATPSRTSRHRSTVHLGRLIHWHAIAGGVSLQVATDDPLGRQAIVELTAPAAGTVAISARLADPRAVIAAGIAVASGADEHFFGLGEQFGGVDQRGHRVGMLVQDGMTTLRPRGGYAPVPFFVSSRGYGFYLATTRPGAFALDAPPATHAWTATVRDGTLRCYVLDGPRPAGVLARYADLAGHPPMPPPWTLGVWKTAIGGQARVLAEARRLRRMRMPVSVIWSYDAVDEAVKLGWPYPTFGRIPPGPYPDLPAFTATLHREGYQALGYLAPEFTPSRPGFAYPAQHGYFVPGDGGHIYLLDLTNPAALAWWEGDERAILTRLGFDGWLLDLGDRLPPGARFADGEGADDLANRYPLLLARAAAAVVRVTKPDALFVMRSGFAGTQALQPAVWAGDQRADWSPTQGLPAAIAAGLSWGISGEPFWGSDIGGYLYGGLSFAQEEELWMRWLEFGALSPIMRDQLGNKGFDAVYVWSNARTEAAFRAYAQLHQSLFPYLYAAARVAHLTGLPIMRHLFLEYPSDPRVYSLNDEYLLGPDLLVAPVITPNAAGRRVYLPAGTWNDFWTDARLAGGRTVTVAAPLDRIPIFVRGGALVPFLRDQADTLAPAGDPAVRRAGTALRLRLYAGGPGESITLADGTRLASTRAAGTIALRVDGPARRYTIEESLSVPPRTVRVNGHPLAKLPDASTGMGWRYDPRSGMLTIEVSLSQGAVVTAGEVE